MGTISVLSSKPEVSIPSLQDVIEKEGKKKKERKKEKDKIKKIIMNTLLGKKKPNNCTGHFQ